MSPRRPAFMFYPADWRKDPELRTCSLEARGLWIDLLCVMHEAEPYGHLVVNGRPLNAEQLARIVGEKPRKTQKILAELEHAGVFELNDKGVVFSRRMVRDEEVRNARAAGGYKALEHPDVPQKKDRTKDTLRGTLPPSSGGSFGGSPSVSSSVSSSPSGSSSEQSKLPDPRFEEAWRIYPKRPNNSKAAAGRQWAARVKEGEDPSEMVEGTRRYAAYVEAERIEPRFVKLASTFFGKDRHYENEFPLNNATTAEPGPKVTIWDEATMGKFQ